MVGVLFAESIGLVLFSWAEGNSWLHNIAHAAALIPICVIALLIEDRRRAASVLVSLGLITACALLVHIWHGAIEAHFLFFVTIVVLALYEDWVPFLSRRLRRDPPRRDGRARPRAASTTTRTPSTTLEVGA